MSETKNLNLDKSLDKPAERSKCLQDSDREKKMTDHHITDSVRSDQSYTPYGSEDYRDSPLSTTFSRLKGTHRGKLLEELHSRYSDPKNYGQRIRYWRKKYLWIFFVEGARYLKRFVDIVFSLVLLILLSPLLFIIALLIKFHDGGPILYQNQRVGKWGKEFRFLKFRTMVINADKMKNELLNQNLHSADIKFKIAGDPRITKIGAILRKTSLDELPQLWCILRGHMSLVGPRPPLPEEVEKYTLEQRRRLDTEPGLTCIWQVSGRSKLPFTQQVELDKAYIESQSFWLDCKLILKTIPAVLFGEGAY